MVEEVALNAVKEAINGINIDRQDAEDIRKYLEEKNKIGFADQLKEHERTAKAIAANKQKSENLVDMRLGKLISDDLFKEKLKALQEEKTALEAKQTEKPVNDRDFMVALDEVLYFLEHADEMFKSSQFDGKRIIIKSLLSNLILKDKKVEFSYTKPFNLFVEGLMCPIFYRERDSNPHGRAANSF